MSKKNEWITDDLLAAGLERAKALQVLARSETGPWTIFQAIARPDGWETITTMLNKGWNFDQVAKELPQIWPGVLEKFNAATGKAHDSFLSGAALRHRMLELARARYHDAESKLHREPAEDKKDEARKVLDEVKNLMARYGWLATKTPKPDKKSQKRTIANGPAKPGATAPVPEAVPPAPVTPEPDPAVQTRPKPTAPPSAKAGPGPENKPGREDAAGLVPWPCPRCEGEMLIKEIKTGKNKGQKFLGCKSFATTRCPGARDLQGNNTTRQ
jgi:hypothetical protein